MAEGDGLSQSSLLISLLCLDVGLLRLAYFEPVFYLDFVVMSTIVEWFLCPEEVLISLRVKSSSFLLAFWWYELSNVFVHNLWSSSILVHPITSEGMLKELLSCSKFNVINLPLEGSPHTMCVHTILVLNHHYLEVSSFVVKRCTMFVLLGVTPLFY